jgi:hypothetical protein
MVQGADWRIPASVNGIRFNGLAEGKAYKEGREHKNQLLDLAMQKHDSDMVGAGQRDEMFGLNKRKLEGQMDDDEQARNLKSLVTGAVDSKRFLARNDVEGLKGYLINRKSEIDGRGGNSTGTTDMLQLLESGDLDAFTEDVNGTIQLGERFGILKGQAAPEPDKSFDNELKLRKEFVDQSKDFVKQNAAFGRIQASANNPSAAGDLSLIFNYMKLLDPGSTVREGEFATAQNAGGVNDRVRAMFNSVQSGERLSPGQRADFFDRSKSLFSEADRQHGFVKQQYSDLATRNGVSPGNVAIDLRAADPSRDVNLQSTQERKSLKGKGYVKIDGQWYEE